MPDPGTLNVEVDSNDIVVLENNEETVQVIEIYETPSVDIVEVTGTGPQGPPGALAASYTFTATTPATTWTINHNLGFKPSVELFNAGSQEIDADVIHTSINQTVVSFTLAVAGFARLN